MVNIELALLAEPSSGKNQGREGELRSDKTSEGGFAGVLAGQEERIEVDAENKFVAPVNQDGKQTAKVESEKRDENGEQSQVGKDDSEDESAEIDVESLFQGLAFKEVPSEEAVIEEISFVEELSQIAGENLQVVEDVPQTVEAGNEGMDGEGFGRRSLLSGSLENRGDLLSENDLLKKVANQPHQNNLLAGDESRNDESQRLFVTDPVVGGQVEVVEGDCLIERKSVVAEDDSVFDDLEKQLSVSEGGVVDDEFTLKNGEFFKDSEILTSISSVSNISAAGDLAVNENEIKYFDDHEFVNDLTKKSESLSILSDESNLISSSIEVVSELESGAEPESVQTKASVVNSNDVKQDQSQGEIHQPPVINVADSSGLTVNHPQKDGLEPQLDVSSSKSNVSANGSTVIDIPEDVQIRINNELSGTVAGAKPENRGVRLGRGRRDVSLSGSEAGTAHLQGRARESQSIFAQGEQNLMNFSDAKTDAGAGVGEKLSFSEANKDIFAEQFSSSTSTQVGAKEKSDLGHSFSKTDEVVIGNLETGKAGLVKNSGDIFSAKPLPVSDENLLDQIQNNLTRQVKGRQTITIKLQPESMGKIDVKLVLRDQQLVATFMVEQSDVKDAMLRKMDSLRDGLAQRGIDVKDIDIKVTPPKSGDGPSVTVGDQHQESADAWRQYHRDGFSHSDSGFAGSTGGESGDEDSVKVSENLPPEIAVRGELPGSLHITA